MNEDLGMDRRTWLLGMGAAGAAAMTVAASAEAAPISPSDGSVRLQGRAVQFADLTHKLTRAFNFSPTAPRIAMESIDGSGKAAGMLLHRLQLNEHTGTHIDAPSHFSAEAASLGEIPLRDLIVPLAVIDIRHKVAADPGAGVDWADIERWEARHGRLPAGCCVAMWSGTDPIPANPSAPRPRAGFGSEAAQALMERRSVKGIAVDTMNIDTGANSPAYPVHQAWLRSGRWGIEGMANLAAVPASGAILIVGAAPIEQATGMPIRAIALY